MLRIFFLWLGLTHITFAADLIIIIDDIGNSQSLGTRTVNLPVPLNLAFLPHTPYSKSLAQDAYTRGHGIMLHAPMANELGSKIGPGGLFVDMQKEILQKTLINNLNVIPHVQGINNHMGSLLTQKTEPMQWVMEITQQHGLFFIDSLTSAHSVALEQAKEMGIPTLVRDVFLDNKRDIASLTKQFNEVVQLAKRRGYAVLICHPYPQTIDFLQKEIPNLAAHDVQLRRLDEFFQERLWLKFPKIESPSRFSLSLTD